MGVVYFKVITRFTWREITKHSEPKLHILACGRPRFVSMKQLRNNAHKIR